MKSPANLAALQREVKRGTHVRVRAALKVIEEEIVRDGCYSKNDGRVTLVEVLKRAGVGASTLRNAHHRELRDDVIARLKKLKSKDPAYAAAAPAAGQKKIAQYEHAMSEMTAQVAVFLSERAEDKRLIEKLFKKIDKLEMQLREVARRDASNVIIFPEMR